MLVCGGKNSTVTPSAHTWKALEVALTHALATGVSDAPLIHRVEAALEARRKQEKLAAYMAASQRQRAAALATAASSASQAKVSARPPRETGTVIPSGTPEVPRNPGAFAAGSVSAKRQASSGGGAPETAAPETNPISHGGSSSAVSQPPESPPASDFVQTTTQAQFQATTVHTGGSSRPLAMGWMQLRLLPLLGCFGFSAPVKRPSGKGINTPLPQSSDPSTVPQADSEPKSPSGAAIRHRKGSPGRRRCSEEDGHPPHSRSPSPTRTFGIVSEPSVMASISSGSGVGASQLIGVSSGTLRSCLFADSVFSNAERTDSLRPLDSTLDGPLLPQTSEDPIDNDAFPGHSPTQNMSPDAVNATPSVPLIVPNSINATPMASASTPPSPPTELLSPRDSSPDNHSPGHMPHSDFASGPANSKVRALHTSSSLPHEHASFDFHLHSPETTAAAAAAAAAAISVALLKSPSMNKDRLLVDDPLLSRAKPVKTFRPPPPPSTTAGATMTSLQQRAMSKNGSKAALSIQQPSGTFSSASPAASPSSSVPSQSPSAMASPRMDYNAHPDPMMLLTQSSRSSPVIPPLSSQHLNNVDSRDGRIQLASLTSLSSSTSATAAMAEIRGEGTLLYCYRAALFCGASL